MDFFLFLAVIVVVVCVCERVHAYVCVRWLGGEVL